MNAYVIAAETPHDETMFAEYRARVVDTVKPLRGKFIARAGELAVPEGEWQHSRTVVIEFPPREAAEGRYKSPDPTRARAEI